VPKTTATPSDSATASESRSLRVAVVSPEPTPYRAPLFDRVSADPKIDLTVIYAARTVAGRTWEVRPNHRSVFLRGVGIPGARLILHHDYPVTPGVWNELRAARPDCVVVSGWSTFASQAAIAWCRVRKVPFLLLVESHDAGPRAGWRRTVKGAVVPRILRRAAGVLVTGTLARESMIAHGARPERIRVFANTIDVDEWSERVGRLADRRAELRAGLGLGEEDVTVLSVARLSSEKGHDTLLRAVAAAGDPRLVLVLAGSGPERDRLEALAGDVGSRLVLAGDLPHERVIEVYCAADIFALLSDREPWGVVVNEAAACGLPLVLSDRVGAAPDLLRDGENGFLVPAGDVQAAAKALRRLTADRARAGARSREIARGWGYGPSVASFVSSVREAV
jgi:glycosyltransferase involved in cell wall biosynthesis